MTKTLDEIANQHLRRSFLDGRTDHELMVEGKTRQVIDEQIAYLEESVKQQFLQWVADTLIGEDIIFEGHANPTHNRARLEESYYTINAKKAEERQILKAHGWEPEGEKDS